MKLQQQPKAPPHSLEAEQVTLGAMMLDNSRIDDLRGVVREDDFYRHDHRLIFRAICAMYDARQSVDAITLPEWLRSRGEFAEAGGMAYLMEICGSTPSAVSAVSYAEIVRERASLRQLISLGGDIAELGYRPDGRESAELLDLAEQQLFAMRQRQTKAAGGPVDLSRLVELAERGIEARKDSADGVTGLPTGIRKLDELTTGLHAGDLIIVAGRPASGKTSFALNIAEHCAFERRKPALVFSMEMPGEQLALRIMASQGRIPLHALRSGRMGLHHWDDLARGGMRLREAPIRIDDTGALSPQELRARARREAMRHSLGLIVVDYIQLMQVPGTKENRTNEIAEVSRSLKALAKELRVPVIALSQLNRGVENRENKRPRMADLRESGSIEQDADNVLFIYRDEVYNPNSPDRGTAEIIVGKQRNGPLGTVRTAWIGEYTRFENLAEGWQPERQETEQQETEQPSGRSFARMRGASHASYAVGND